MPRALVCISLITLLACSRQDNAQSDTPPKQQQLSAQNAPVANSPTEGKGEQSKRYAQAIEAYMDVLYEKEKIKFDTLFLGKNPQFPDIDLPASIRGVAVRLLAGADIQNKQSVYSKSAPYINLIGFEEKEAAEFIFVAFYPQFEHQYDCYINLVYDAAKKDFVVGGRRVETLVRNKEGKAEYYKVYENGQYKGNKPIKQR